MPLSAAPGFCEKEDFLLDMGGLASKIKEPGAKTLYFLAKILYINHRGQPKNCLILLREVLNLAISSGAEIARA